ncbi:hypothetical protein AMTRI_Chr10g8090 [Amborella trichopoda]
MFSPLSQTEDKQMNGSPLNNGVQIATLSSICHHSTPSTSVMSPEHGSHGCCANVRYCVNVNGNGMLGNVVPNESQVRQRRRIERAFDDLAERRQKRNTENRESAARSRARKQAYTCQLDITFKHLKEDNARLTNHKLFSKLLAETPMEPSKTLKRSTSAPF